MFRSRAEKILTCLPTNEILEQKPEEKEYFVLKNVDPTPSTSKICSKQTEPTLDKDFDFSINSVSKIMSASTSMLIDECLANGDLLNDANFDVDIPDVVLETSDTNLPKITSDEYIEGSISNNLMGDSTTPNIIVSQNGFVCFHCNLVFSKKKVMRRHIIDVYLQTEISSEEENITDTADNLPQNQQQKKNKTENDARATSVKKRNERKHLRISGKAYRSVKGNLVQEKKIKEFTCSRVCQFKCSTSFSNEEKDNLFFSFWKIGAEDKSQDRQRQYLVDRIEEVKVKRLRVLYVKINPEKNAHLSTS